MSYFVTGTGTGVGKTVVSGVIAAKHGLRYWKPIQSGLDSQTDSEWIANLIGPDRVQEEAYRLTQPLSPHESARLDGISIDLDRICEKAPGPNTIIEGAGGVLVPIDEKSLFADLAQRLARPTILVASTALGTINHTLLSLEALRARAVQVIGVIMVGDENPANRRAIEHYGKIDVLGEIPMVPEFTFSTLVSLGSRIAL